MQIKPTLWNAAITNKKLTPYIYRLMRGRKVNNALFSIPTHLDRQTVFKQAYHSDMTKPEVRAFLLHSTFTSHREIYNTLSAVNPKLFPPKDESTFYITIREHKGIPYIEMLNRAIPIKFVPRITQAIQAYRHPQSHHQTLIEAVISEDQQGIYVAQGKNELFVLLYALVDLLRNFIKVNDVGNVFYNYRDADENNREVDEINIDYARAIRDLQHMKRQLDKFKPIANRINVNFDNLESLIDNFIAGLYYVSENKSEDPTTIISLQYRLASEIPDILAAAHDKIAEVKAVPKEAFPKRFPIPKFVDYNLDKNHFHRQKVNNTNFLEDIKRIETFLEKRIKTL